MLCPHTSQLELLKNEFHIGLATACRSYRDLYMPEWCRILTLTKVTDWKSATKYNLAKYTRILTLQAGVLTSHASVKAQIDFSTIDSERIHTLVLDCHNDVGTSGAQGQWSYKRILPVLPKNLKSLVILNAHGPDLQIIQRAIQQCEGLEHLSLGRCTKFNQKDTCAFWQQFPNDHDSYFSIKGVDGYAEALVTELRGLPKLKSVRVNVYLTDTKYLEVVPGAMGATENSTLPPPYQTMVATATTSTPITTITTSVTTSTTPIPPITNETKQPNSTETHEGTPTVPENAQSEPVRTEAQDRQETIEAEKSSARILFDGHPSLKTVGFISYWSPDHLGWSLHDREPKDYAVVSHHKAPDPGGRFHTYTDCGEDLHT